MIAIDPVRFVAGRPMLLAGIRRRHTFGGAAESIPAQWEDFNRVGPIPGRTDGTAYGAMCATWLDEQAFEYLSGVEVDSFDALPPELGRMRVPAQRYAVFEHHGSIATIQQTWGRIWREWVPRSGLTPGDTPDFERYDGRFDPATGQGIVEIWFPIQEREAADAQD